VGARTTCVAGGLGVLVKRTVAFFLRGSGKSTEELIERGPERVSYLHFLCVGLVGSKTVL
jgi:hypothetical protein